MEQTPMNIDDKTRTELEAAAFRRCVEHLRERTRRAEHRPDESRRLLPQLPVQLVQDAADERGLELGKEDARELVYGMPYEEWQAKHQTEASPEQMAKFAQSPPDRASTASKRCGEGIFSQSMNSGDSAGGFLDPAPRGGASLLAEAGRGPRSQTGSTRMDSATVNASHLRAFLERIEKLEEEKRAIADDIKDVYAEAKGTGFDAKIIRKIVSMRRMDREKRREEEEILDLYLTALGMVD